MSHLDRYLASYPGIVDKNLFHLLSMTCLYLAIKLNEYKHLLIPGSTSTMDTILQLSRGIFTLEQMEKMENDVLQRLQWYVHPPTSQVFLRHFLLLCNSDQREAYDLAKFLIELSVMDYFFVSYRPSEIAAAAILNTMDMFSQERNGRLLDLPLEMHQYELNPLNIQACRERLTQVYGQASGGSAAANDYDASSIVDDGVRDDQEMLESSDRRPSPVSVMNIVDMYTYQ